MTSIRVLTAALVVPAAVLVALARPAALPVLVLITVAAAAGAWVWSCLLDGRTAADAASRAVRAGVRAFAVAVAVAALLLVLGPASVPVLALLAVATAAGVALLLRPAGTTPRGPEVS